MRPGFSLLEIMIAMTILITAIAMALQGMIASQQLTAMGNAQDDISFDSDRVMAIVSADISLSGWDGAGPAGPNFIQDRTNYYLPYVMQQALPATGGGPLLEQGLGAQFDHARRPINMVDLNLPESLLGDPDDATTNFDETDTDQRVRYRQSFYARSQELLFLRIANAPWAPEPAPLKQLREPFRPGDWTDLTEANRGLLGILHPSPWAETALNSDIFVRRPETLNGLGESVPYGHIIHGGRLVINGGDVTLVPNWETIEAPPVGSVTGTDWREYQYAVVPSPTGLGRLVRAVKVRTATVPGPTMGVEVGQFISPIGAIFAMRVQEVLSDHVVRIVFNTYRTDTTLDINQIGVRIHFARASVLNRDLVLTRVLDTVLAMRTRASDSDVSEIQTFIPSSVGFDY